MFTDVKYALRQLRKSPGFALTAMITLALGIGANAVVFSVLNALILRPVKVPKAENLYMVQRGHYPSQSYLDYIDLRDRNRSFDSLMVASIMGPLGVNEGRSSSTVWPYMVSGNYFDGLGIQPSLGRFFHASDEKGKNSAPYIVLTDDYWRSHYNADRGVIGRVVELNRHPFTIIGVAPRGFRGTEIFFAPAIFVPILEEPILQGSDNLQYRGDHSPWIVGRLRPGVTPAQATADLNGIGVVVVQDLSGRRRRSHIHPCSPRPYWRYARRSRARFHDRPHAACRPHSAGRLRQSRQPVRSPRSRSRKGSRSPPRARIAPRAHPASTTH